MASAGFCQLNAPNNESADECFLLSGVSPISITKIATNIVFSEVTLHEPLGLFRSVVLAWPEGVNALASYLWLGFQATVVPVGISSLGRIMNAVDSPIDPFLGSAVFFHRGPSRAVRTPLGRRVHRKLPKPEDFSGCSQLFREFLDDSFCSTLLLDCVCRLVLWLLIENAGIRTYKALDLAE